MTLAVEIALAVTRRDISAVQIKDKLEPPHLNQYWTLEEDGYSTYYN
ncbi:MAG: hypothetical protein ACTHKP_16070 [Nitrososphaeraceae archaeon]